MATAQTFTGTGAKAASAAKLDSAVFAVEIKNHELLKLAYEAYLANGRGNLAVTRTRGLISGGGRKPWRQKGTGRARIGSSRAPHWRGGGVVFGPTGTENYSLHVPVQAKRQALRQALSQAAAEKRVLVLEDLTLKDAKTAALAALLAKLGAARQTLLVVDHKSEELLRASRNLQNVKLVQAAYVNVYDTVNADHLIFTSAALQQVTERLAGKPKQDKGGEQS